MSRRQGNRSTVTAVFSSDELIKKLRLPSGGAPRTLVDGKIEAQAIGREHLDDDVAGINASLELIPRTRGGRWPTGPVTAEENFVDLVWHECEFRDGASLTYALYHAEHGYIGCWYLYPVGRRTPLTEALLRDYDVDVSWWVTPPAYERGDYAAVYAAVRFWLAEKFGSWRPYYSNEVLPSTIGR